MTANSSFPLRAAIALCAGALCLASAHAQQTGDERAINNAISEAVQSGETRYRPLTPAQTKEQLSLEAECQSLADKLNATPRQRRYNATGPEIETAQGLSSPGLERDRTRKSLEASYRAKCTQ
ncbi:hypothetical protein [Cupriavidus respiraculi]|uniref:hypothetical protein n=1 Tax=Cupriavidus respiraculi TaxID=195930 RepID=UPI001F333BE9|nr:hypothetical protein [Cupriavidus respiraculi]